MNIMDTMNTYVFEELKEVEHKYLLQAAKCLGETFVGVQVKDYVVSEPLISATQLTVEEFTEVSRLYLENTLHQGFHFIAIDQKTDKVVGVIGADIFDAYEDVFVYDGNLEAMNRVTEFLINLDHLFVEKFEHILGRKAKQGDLLHGYFIGVQTPKNKHFIAKKLVELVLEKGAKEGYKGFFVEATNPRSQKLVKQEFGAYVPTAVDGKPLLNEYKDAAFFNDISPEISTCTEILYIPIDHSIDLK